MTTIQKVALILAAGAMTITASAEPRGWGVGIGFF